MEKQMLRKVMVPETGEPQSKENKRLGSTCGNVRPIDRKRLSIAPPAPWQPDQWLGFGKVD
jgi:hypothetical protein